MSDCIKAIPVFQTAGDYLLLNLVPLWLQHCKSHSPSFSKYRIAAQKSYQHGNWVVDTKCIVGRSKHLDLCAVDPDKVALPQVDRLRPAQLFNSRSTSTAFYTCGYSKPQLGPNCGYVAVKIDTSNTTTKEIFSAEVYV